MSPRVTIVVTQRERTSLTQHSLENILADRSEPFHLIYVVGDAPDGIRAYLRHRAAGAGFTLIERSERLWPNAARNLALPLVDTEYVAFIDNDIEVEPGWLKTLVGCADETGAAIVGPLYLLSDGVGEPRIHMAGGTLTRVDTPAGVALHEQHERINAPLSDRAQLKRAPCDFLEYHCLLARIDFLRNIGGLNEDIVCVHEHIDIALEAAKAGREVVLEPAAAVVNLALAPFRLSDLAFHRWRWDLAAADRSLRALAEKWTLADDDVAFAGVRRFVEAQLSAIDPLARDLKAAAPEGPLSVDDVKQNLYRLLTQASTRGYARKDIELFASAYNAAMTLFAGGFRPCARPFIAHCTGTASALVAFGFAPRIVIAGMLHAAYSHAPLGPQPQAALADLAQQLRITFGDPVERRIRDYARMQLDPAAWRAARPLETMTLDDAEIMVIAIANSIDECAAGEPAFSAKSPPAPDWIAYARDIAATLGAPEFAETLACFAQTSQPEDFDMRRPHGESFRLVKGGLAPMAHGAFRAWDKSRVGQTPPAPALAHAALH